MTGRERARDSELALSDDHGCKLVHECFPDLVLPPQMVVGTPEGYRDRIELRVLETWLESVRVSEDPTPPAPAAGAPPPSCVISTSRSAHEVLGGLHLLKEVDLGMHVEHIKSKETKDASTMTSNRESPCVLHRKRVHWTEDEVKAMKYFAGAFRKGQNIPWRKIKKYGADIFHQEHWPADLKDKWKHLKKGALTP